METHSTQSLEVHVFGGSQGESIVIRTPSDEWGVVDCYASSLKDENSNPTLVFLRSRGVTQLSFLCLTHPHEDHFRGMSQLLKKFDVRTFWRPDAMGGTQLRMILKSHKVDAIRSNTESARENADELEAIFATVKAKRTSQGQPFIPKDLSLGHLAFPIPHDSNAEFQILVAAPSTRQKIRYEIELARCFDADLKFKDQLPNERHNIVSLALVMVYGKTRIILGGDVEQEGWQHALEEFGEPQLIATAVKVRLIRVMRTWRYAWRTA